MDNVTSSSISPSTWTTQQLTIDTFNINNNLKVDNNFTIGISFNMDNNPILDPGHSNFLK